MNENKNTVREQLIDRLVEWAHEMADRGEVELLDIAADALEEYVAAQQRGETPEPLVSAVERRLAERRLAEVSR